MKSSKIKLLFSKSSVWAGIYVAALVLIIAIYCVDVFIYHNSPTENLRRSLIAALVLTASLCLIIYREKSSLAAVKKACADKIGNAFEHNKTE